VRSRQNPAGRHGLVTTLRALVVLMVAAGTIAAVPTQANAATSQFKGVNWADARDNFVNGVLFVSGLSASDTYASATTVANQVVGQLYSITGANTVRMPINEPTVSSYWATYTGAIDAALTKGNVILAYWAVSNGKPASTTAFNQMWDTVVAKYGTNANAYFEVINEPFGFSTTDVNNFYNTWLTRYPSVPRGHVILDGTGFAQNVAAVGSDSRLNNTLLAAHDYSFFVDPPFEDETDWATHVSGEIGSFASRTVVTEWGGPMMPGSKNGVNYNTIDYSIPSGSFFADYIRGVSGELRELGVGSVYWPGLRDGDWYSMTTKTGSGAGIKLTLANASGLTRLQYAWGIGTGGGTNVTVRNTATALAIDGLGRTASGSTAGQWSLTGSTNQQWVIENDGTFVRIRNRATGLYLDGMGRTTNGSAAGQFSNTNAINQQWTVITDGNSVRIKNRATGLFIDGMGRTTNGADLGQFADTNATNQQWTVVAAG
jgi:hypothetical protein